MGVELLNILTSQHRQQSKHFKSKLIFLFFTAEAKRFVSSNVEDKEPNETKAVKSSISLSILVANFKAGATL